MNRLAKLRKPLDEMSSDELHDLVRHIRADRRLTKERPSVKRKAARSKDKDKSKLASLLDGLTPEELEALLGEHTGDAVGTKGRTP